MEIDLEIFVAGLNIKGISESIAKSLISAGYDTINKMFDATIDQLIQIKGIELVTAEKINKGFKSKLNVIKNLLDIGITIKKPLIITDGKLKDLSFCVTGSLVTMKRKDFEDIVKKNGGQLKSVGKGLSYLLTNDPNSGSEKNNKAQELCIKLITEDQFLAMIK